MEYVRRVAHAASPSARGPQAARLREGSDGRTLRAHVAGVTPDRNFPGRAVTELTRAVSVRGQRRQRTRGRIVPGRRSIGLDRAMQFHSGRGEVPWDAMGRSIILDSIPRIALRGCVATCRMTTWAPPQTWTRTCAWMPSPGQRAQPAAVEASSAGMSFEPAEGTGDPRGDLSASVIP